MDGSTNNNSRDSKKENDEEEKLQDIRKRLLFNISAMSRAQRRRRAAASKRVQRPNRVGYHLSGAASGWGEAPSHRFYPSGEDGHYEPQKVRLSDGSTWKLSRDEEPSAFDRLLQEERQRPSDYWDLAGDILQKGGFDLDRRHDYEWRPTAICQCCQQRVFYDELAEALEVPTVGEKRKREDYEVAMEGSCRACRSRSLGVTNNSVDQEEYQSTPTVQTSTACDRGPSRPQQEFLGSGVGSLSEYNDDADPGGLLRRLGGLGIRPGSVRRVDIRTAQSSIPEFLPGWIEDECEGKRESEKENPECSDPPSDQHVSRRELREGISNDASDLSSEGSMGPIETADQDPLDYLFSHWDSTPGSSSSFSSSSDDDAPPSLIYSLSETDSEWWASNVFDLWSRDDTDYS